VGTARVFPFFTNPDGEQTINWFTEPTYGLTGLIYKTQYPDSEGQTGRSPCGKFSARLSDRPRGRLTLVRSNGTDVRYEQYDALGRVTAHTQVTDTVSYPFSYQYNLADQVTLLHYPSGREVATTYNGAGRPEGVTGYASSIAYAPFGGMTRLALANGVTESTAYDSRLRMSSIEAKTADQTKLLGLNYTYYNNSNVQTQQITGLGVTANQSYGFGGDSPRVSVFLRTFRGLAH
jgi:YD repeat-containing protein